VSPLTCLTLQSHLRRVPGHVSNYDTFDLLLQDAFKTRFKGMHHRFDCRLGHYVTNTRHPKGCASTITNKSEMFISLTHRRFDCRLGPL
jgi:hypothetical protein